MAAVAEAVVAEQAVSNPALMTLAEAVAVVVPVEKEVPEVPVEPVEAHPMQSF